MIITVWPFPTQKRMTVFTVHEQPVPPLDRIDRAEAVVFLKDGFTWSAFLFGPIWLLANRLWLAALGYVVVTVLGYILLDVMGAAETLFGIFLIAVNMIVGFEAHWLKSAKLDATGWTLLGSVTGRGRTECERRFFERWLPTQPMLRADATSAPIAQHADALQPQSLTGQTERTHAAAKPKRDYSAFFRQSREG